jgi:hypothetical protein
MYLTFNLPHHSKRPETTDDVGPSSLDRASEPAMVLGSGLGWTPTLLKYPVETPYYSSYCYHWICICRSFGNTTDRPARHTAPRRS